MSNPAKKKAVKSPKAKKAKSSSTVVAKKKLSDNQVARNYLSTQESNVYDLNLNTGFTENPDRIWPD